MGAYVRDGVPPMTVIKWEPSDDSDGIDLLDADGGLIAWVRPSATLGTNTWAWDTWIGMDDAACGQAADEQAARKAALISLALWREVSCALEPNVEFGQGGCAFCKLDRASKMTHGACYACEVDRSCTVHEVRP